MSLLHRFIHPTLIYSSLIGKDDMKESISRDERVMIDLKFFLVPTHTTSAFPAIHQ